MVQRPVIALTLGRPHPRRPGRARGNGDHHKARRGDGDARGDHLGGDPRHFERMQHVAKAGAAPAAILFADLEASSPLARRLSTASYFALGRRLVRAADQCVIDAGGLVGRHAATASSRSSSPRPPVRSRPPRAAASRRPARSASAIGRGRRQQRAGAGGRRAAFRPALGLEALRRADRDRGRAEVTALGDEVNEAARIEACATGGRALASKDLMERLEPDDAAALDLDPDRITYTALADLDARPRRPAATHRRSRCASYSRTSVSLNAGHVLGLRTDREQGPFIRQALERVGSPRSSNCRPEPATRSFTVRDTRTSPGPASAATRAAMWTAMPLMSPVAPLAFAGV